MLVLMLVLLPSELPAAGVDAPRKNLVSTGGFRKTYAVPAWQSAVQVAAPEPGAPGIIVTKL